MRQRNLVLCSDGGGLRGARRVRSQARDGREQRQVQQLPASPAGGYGRGAERGLERHRQGIAAGPNQIGGRLSDTERGREDADQRYDDDHHPDFLHNVAAGQRGEHRAGGRLPDERVAAVLDTAQENLPVADARYGEIPFVEQFFLIKSKR